MAHFFGSSGCTAKLVHDLQALDVPEVSTFTEVERLFGGIDTRLAERRAHEEHLQRATAEVARDGASMVEQSIASRVREREIELAMERGRLPAKIQGVASEISRSRLKGLLHIPRWLGLRHRLRTLTNHLEREARSPFRRELAQVERLRVTAETIGRDMPAVVEARVAPYLRAKSYLESNKSWVFGARGEERVLDVLRGLPDEFSVISDVVVDLGRSARWRARPGVRVRSAQIDHVVVGPHCVFLLETKNWSSETADEMASSSHEQISRAAYVFNVLAYSQFGKRKMRRRDVVVHLNDKSGYWKQLAPPYQYVTQVPVDALVSYIRSQPPRHEQGSVTAAETVAWLLEWSRTRIGGSCARSRRGWFW
jgi:hypothetical protein